MRRGAGEVTAAANRYSFISRPEGHPAIPRPLPRLSDAQWQLVVAHEDLYRRAARKKHGDLRRWFGREEVEDRFQEAAMRAVAGYDPAKGELTHLIRKAVHNAFRDLQRAGHKLGRPGPAFAADGAAQKPPDDGARAAASRERAARLLAWVPPDDRQLIELRFGIGPTSEPQSYRAIAKFLGIPGKSTVQERLRKALRSAATLAKMVEAGDGPANGPIVDPGASWAVPARGLKLTCGRAELLGALSAVLKCAGPGKLADVLAVARGGRLTLTATDHELAASATVAAAVQSAGSAVLPAAVADLLRRHPAGAVGVSAGRSGVFVFTGDNRFELRTYPPSEFPEAGGEDLPSPLELPSAELTALVRSTAFAAGRNGVQLEVEADRLRAVATDGRRLAVAECAAAGAPAAGTVTAKALDALARLLLLHPEGGVRVGLGPNHATFSGPRWSLRARLVERRPLPWRDALGGDGATATATTSPAELAAALRQIAVVDGEAARATFALAPGRLTVTAESATFGRGEVSLPVAYAGPPWSADYDPAMVLGAARAAPAGPLNLDVREGPAVLRAAGWRCLVAPMGR